MGIADQRIQVLLCGDFADPEMQPALAALAHESSRVDIRTIDALPSTEGDIAAERWSPDLLVIAQQRPGQFPLAGIRRLQRLFPLTRCVCCQGAWCESDGRNISDWPAAVRIPARVAAARIRREISVLAGRTAPLPLTASRDEIFALDCPGDWPARNDSLPVSVVSPDAALRHMLEDLLKSAGYATTTVIGKADARAVVWDVDPWDQRLEREIRTFCAVNPALAVVGLMNFGHPQEAAMVQAAGVRAVVPKLASAELLLEALAGVLGERPVW